MLEDLTVEVCILAIIGLRHASLTYVNPKYPAARLTLYRVQPVTADPAARPVTANEAEHMTGLYKASYYGIEPTFNVAKVEAGQLYVHTLYGMTPAYRQKSAEGVFFMPKGEAVTFEGNELWVENCRGVKWEHPLAELQALAKKHPTHRLLSKWVLNQIAAHLRELGRTREAKEVRALMKQLHAKKK